MGKRERKTEAIKKYIGNISGNWTAYSYGKIPKSIALNAINTYAGAIQYQDILGLVDITVLGNGKKGMLFTEHKIYYNNGMLESNGNVSYKQINETNSIPAELFGCAYNRQALKELVSILAGIEGESVQGTVDDINNAINNTLDNVSKNIQSLGNTLEKVGSVAGALFSLFDLGDSSKESKAIEEKNKQ